MAFTKINAAGIGSTETVTLDGLSVINNGSFGGNLTVGGVLTYEDVTNVDSVGLITARNGIVVGSGITLSKDGDGFFTGVITATSYSGIDLSDVTGATGDFSIADKIVHTGDTDTALRFPAADTITAETGGSERLRINSSGNVGLGGQTNPSAALHIQDLSANGYELKLSGNAIQFNRTSLSYIDQYNDTGSIVFRMTSSNTEALRIDSSGRLLLGTTTEGVANASNFTIAGAVHCGMTIRSGTTNDGQIAFSDGTSGDDEYRGQILYRHSSDHMHFVTNAVERVRIFSNGDIGVNATTVNRADAGRNTIQFDYSGSDGSEGLEIRLSNSALNGNAATDNAAITYIGQNLGITNRENGVITFRNNGSEAMRITASGQVSVGGNASPDGEFHVYEGDAGCTADTSANLGVFETDDNSGGITILTPNTGKQNIYFGTSGTGGAYEAGIRYTHESHGTTADRRAMSFRAGGTEYVRLQESMMRIGDSQTSASAGRLQVIEERGGGQNNDTNVYFETNANDWNLKTYYNSAGTHYHIQFIEQGATRGSISGADGSNVNFNQGSDYRWKENIVRMTGDEGIEICKKLKPSKYNWIENREETGQINTVDGFIAHEVVEAGVLGAVTGEKDAVNEDGSIKGQELDYGQMTPVLAAAIKGLIDKVETLESEVAALKSS